MKMAGTQRAISKYIDGMEYVKNVLGKSGGRLVQQDFRDNTKLNAVAIKAMAHFGYIKKVSRGIYTWNLGDTIEPKAARNVYEYVLNYFRDNAKKRENKVVQPRHDEEDLMAQDLIPSTPEEDIEALKDWINDLCRQKSELLTELDSYKNETQSAIKWIDELKKESEMFQSLYNMASKELQEMQEEHNAIVKDIMESPFIEPTFRDPEPASKSYYFLGIPIWSIKFK